MVQRYDDLCAAGATPALREATLQQVGAFELLSSAQKLSCVLVSELVRVVAFPVQALGDGTACQLTLRIPATMRAPVFLYYELDNYFQNHRRYTSRAILP